MKKISVLGALGLLLGLALAPLGARADVATSGAVLLDPFDPVPAIQYHHFGGSGCYDGCGGCDYGCGYNRCVRGCYRHSRCGDGCYRHTDCGDGCNRCDGCNRHDCDGCNRHADCGDGCDRHTDCDGCRRADCDHDCHDGDDGGRTKPCLQGNCYDAEHYERRWRDGDRVVEDWMDRGHKERIDNHHHWSSGAAAWHDDDDDLPPPPPPPGPPPHH